MKPNNTNHNQTETKKKRLGFLTDAQEKLIREQVRKNSKAMDDCIRTIDLLINKEECPKDANTLLKLRKRLEVAMAENDTFRKVLWNHVQMVEQGKAAPEGYNAISFLASRIKTRKFALIAQKAMK